MKYDFNSTFADDIISYVKLRCSLGNEEDTYARRLTSFDKFCIKVQAGISFAKEHHPRVYDFRHANASLLINAGIPAKVIAEHLGHHSTQTTENVYSHFFASTKAKTTEAINLALGK